MDRLAVAFGALATTLALLAAFVASGTPEAVVAALVAAGVVTGAASRNYQSEFLDAWAAGTVGTALAVTVLFFGLGGLRATNRLYGDSYNWGVVVYLGAVAFSFVIALIAAFGGGLGARIRYRALDAFGRW